MDSITCCLYGIHTHIYINFHILSTSKKHKLAFQNFLATQQNLKIQPEPFFCNFITGVSNFLFNVPKEINFFYLFVLFCLKRAQNENWPKENQQTQNRYMKLYGKQIIMYTYSVIGAVNSDKIF